MTETTAAGDLQPSLTIERPDQLKALGHPLRLRVLERLSGSKPMTNRALAAELGVDPGHLHFHVRMLLRVGLIESAEGGIGREKPYRAVSHRIQVSPELRAAGLLGSTHAALIESVSRGWVAYGAQDRFGSLKATAHVHQDTLRQLLRDFFARVQEAEEAALANGDEIEELRISVFHHPPPPQSLSAGTGTHLAGDGPEDGWPHADGGPPADGPNADGRPVHRPHAGGPAA